MLGFSAGAESAKAEKIEIKTQENPKEKYDETNRTDTGRFGGLDYAR
jgi:hypothetical protein